MDAAEERRKEDAGIDARPIYGLYGFSENIQKRIVEDKRMNVAEA